MVDPHHLLTRFCAEPATYFAYGAFVLMVLAIPGIAEGSHAALDFAAAGLLAGAICFLIAAYCRRRARLLASDQDETIEDGPADPPLRRMIVGTICFVILAYSYGAFFITPHVLPAKTPSLAPTGGAGSPAANSMTNSQHALEAKSAQGDTITVIGERLRQTMGRPREFVDRVRDLVSPPPPEPEVVPAPGSMWILVGDRVSEARFGSDFRPDGSGPGPARFNSYGEVGAAASRGDPINAAGLQARRCRAAGRMDGCSSAPAIDGQRRMRQISVADDGGVWVRVET